MELNEIKNDLEIISKSKDKNSKIAKTILNYISNMETDLINKNNTIERLLKEKR